MISQIRKLKIREIQRLTHDLNQIPSQHFHGISSARLNCFVYLLNAYLFICWPEGLQQITSVQFLSQEYFLYFLKNHQILATDICFFFSPIFDPLLIPPPLTHILIDTHAHTLLFLVSCINSKLNFLQKILVVIVSQRNLPSMQVNIYRNFIAFLPLF